MSLEPATDGTRPHGCFLASRAGRIFLMHYPAAAQAGAAVRYVLCVPPFAEEMNKSRRMWTLLAERLHARGLGVMVPDLFGTGDSEGDFADARWPQWREDLSVLARFAVEAGARQISVCALRLGAALALDWLARSSPQPVDRVVLWQPVVNGSVLLTQFLRLRLAASLRQTAPASETTTRLRERLAAGESLEIAGYELAHELARDIDALRLEALLPPVATPVSWFELQADPARGLAPASSAVVTRWRAADRQVETQVIAAEAFWSMPEITVAEALIDASELQLVSAH